MNVGEKIYRPTFDQMNPLRLSTKEFIAQHFFVKNIKKNKKTSGKRTF